MKRVTIGDYLLQRLAEIGIQHLFGVPGDFNLAFLEQLLAHPGLEWVGCCNELNAAYAADGYGRLHGIGALVVTYGVGDLSAINGVAGAYAEHIPLVVISGAPPLEAIRNRQLLHHTAGTGGFEDVLHCMAQFTAAQSRITPANAASEIDRLLRTALRDKLPVYLQIPSDITHLEIEAPAAPLNLASYSGDPLQTERVVAEIVRRLAAAERPALLVDADATRYGLRPLICALGERTGMPFASMVSGRSIFNEQHPLYRGIYAGQASSDVTRQTIEQADCLLTIGVRFFDATTCFFSHQIPTNRTIELDPYSVTIDGKAYEGIYAAEVLSLVAERLPQRALPAAPAVEPAPVWQPTDAALTQARLWPRIGAFLRSGDVIIAENGTPQSGLNSVRLPANTAFVSQATWGSIGYTLPALLGTALAAPQRRQLLFIGDGSLQMTAQEISTFLRQQLKPVFFVLNNRGYTIERVILGPHSVYNDIQNWNYTALPAVFADGAPVRTFSVHTERELDAVLAQLDTVDALTLVELHLDPLDAPAGLKRMGPMIADFDYGDRGPQHLSDASKG